ncbi:esterase-like activity of phytase family protein [Tropicibacter sp. Alg240-R139]|uniref:esterase-like activity of phytase family protein n=1 Tax=Tropicibacter sp. Alg240-R139 TaxID=2305991 RepID=UPI0013DF3B8D|nr:esterase-like activity of phytase family protein [Tropicibacter sp. Alg240-R139]
MRLSFAISIIFTCLLAGSVVAVDTAKATYLSSYSWDNSAPWFGGFSALEISADGRNITVLNDRGVILTARVSRTETNIDDIEITSSARVLSSTGKTLRGLGADSEGLAIAEDGTVFISFEGIHRIAHYNRSDSTTSVLLHPDAFKKMAINGSFEALAIDNQNRLYTMPESGLTAERRIPVYRWNGRRWSQPFTLPKSGEFLPVGADIGPDGRLYLLERSAGILGFRTQLRRWDMLGGQPSNGKVLIKTHSSTHDNLEGLSIWRDADEKLRATMVSDDNFLFIQRTELVEYALPD